MLFEPEELRSLTFTIEEPVNEQRAIRHERVRIASGPLCPYWKKGTCQRGNECRMRHAKTEKTDVVCKHWLRGLCKKDENCEFLHEYDLSKMQPCHFFINFGVCSNPDCYFLHVRPEDQLKDCPWYKRGFCKLGPNCKNVHRRLQACPRYLAGFCYKGPDCEFGHPKFEMPEEEQKEPEHAEGLPRVHKRQSNVCFRCGQPGHTVMFCPLPEGESLVVPQPSSDSHGRKRKSEPLPLGAKGKPGMRPLETVTCFRCKQLGHYANSCPLRFGGAPGRGGPAGPQQQQGGFYPPPPPPPPPQQQYGGPGGGYPPY